MERWQNYKVKKKKAYFKKIKLKKKIDTFVINKIFRKSDIGDTQNKKRVLMNVKRKRRKCEKETSESITN